MVRLRDGRALVLGGANAGEGLSGCKHSADLFDPASSSWSAAAPMARGRCGAIAVVLRGGRVLVAGGDSRHTWRSAEIYNPVTNRWSMTAQMHIARDGASAALLPHGQALVAGGFGVSGLEQRSAEIYNPKTGRWHWTDPMSMGRVGMGHTRMRNGDLLVAGDCPPKTHLLTAERYVVRRHVWRPAGHYDAPDCPNVELFRLPTGKVLAIPTYGRKVHRYNPVTNRWMPAPLLPRAVAHWFQGMVSVDGRPMVLASHLRCDPPAATAIGYLWRPQKHQWVRWTAVPSPLDRDFSTLRLRDGSILVAGGQPQSCSIYVPSRLAFRYYPEG